MLVNTVFFTIIIIFLRRLKKPITATSRSVSTLQDMASVASARWSSRSESVQLQQLSRSTLPRSAHRVAPRPAPRTPPLRSAAQAVQETNF